MSQICYVDGTEDRSSDEKASSLLKTFNAKGYATSLDAEAAFYTAFPDPLISAAGNSMGLIRAAVKHIAADNWSIAAEWTTRQRPFGTRKFRGQITQTTINIKNAALVSSGAVVGPAPNLYGAINVSQGSDGLEVAGVDIPTPGLAFSITETLAPGTITLSWIKALLAFANTANSATWNEFAAGEVQFMGVEFGNDANEGSETVTYNFEAQPTVTSIDLGGLMTVPVKQGWDYLWVLLENAVDAAAKSLIARPRAWYIHRVVPRKSWTGFVD